MVTCTCIPELQDWLAKRAATLRCCMAIWQVRCHQQLRCHHPIIIIICDLGSSCIKRKLAGARRETRSAKRKEKPKHGGGAPYGAQEPNRSALQQGRGGCRDPGPNSRTEQKTRAQSADGTAKPTASPHAPCTACARGSALLFCSLEARNFRRLLRCLFSVFLSLRRIC